MVEGSEKRALHFAREGDVHEVLFNCMRARSSATYIASMPRGEMRGTDVQMRNRNTSRPGVGGTGVCHERAQQVPAQRPPDLVLVSIQR